MELHPGIGRLGLTPRARALFTPDRLRGLPADLLRRPAIQALLYAALAEHATSVTPEERTQAREPYLASLALNLTRLQRLDALLLALRAADLRVLVIKGGLLCRTHYGDPGARPMADIDLVCAPADVPRAAAVIRGQGLAPLAHERRRVAAEAVHDVQFSDGVLWIELHHRLWHELGLPSDVAPVIERAVEVPFGPGRAWAPTPADHLYIVLIHAATHGFAGNPLWMADALLLAQEPELWSEARALAALNHASLPLAAAIEHLALVFPDLVPAGAAGVAPAPVRRFVLRRLAGVLQQGDLGTFWRSRLARSLLVKDPAQWGRWALAKVRLAMAAD